MNTWYEREVQEFSNIVFLNSIDCRTLLLPYSYINSNSILKDKNSNLYSLKYNAVSRDISLLKRYDVIL